MEIRIWMVFVILLLILIFLGYGIYTKKNGKEVSIVAFIFIFIYFFYSFFTVNGSVRLAIAMYGHPDVAYTTKLVYNHYLNNSKVSKNKKYVGAKTHMDDYGSYFECKSYGLIKITTYYGF